MFPLHQGKNLAFQNPTSNTCNQKSSNSNDGCSSTVLSNNTNTNTNTNTGKRRRESTVADPTIIENTMEDKKKKMMLHRENERKRRQELATLYSSLRSLLPLEFIKGKRSTSDHMNEAVNYINHLQKRIQTLDAKRCELKKLPNLSTTSFIDPHPAIGTSLNSDMLNVASSFKVQPSFNGVQILVSSGFKEEGSPLISISSVLEMLIEQQGLEVVACVSTKVNERLLLHTIQIEVNDVEGLDLAGLEQKLAKAFPTSRNTIFN